MEFDFRGGVYRSAAAGPPEFVAAVDIEVEAEAEDADSAEELARERLEEMLADGFFVGEDLTLL